MKTALSSILLLALLFAVPAVGDDQQKTQKELAKITALSNDVTGRRIVNLSMAGMFNLKRLDLVQERKRLGMNYGSLLMMHSIVSSGVDWSVVAHRLESRATLAQIAEEHKIAWEKILSDAKKLNKAIDLNLLRHFSGNTQLEKMEKQEDYNVVNDAVPADVQISEDDVSQAAARYLFLREHAYTSNYRGGSVSGNDRNAANADQSRRGGGGVGTRGGIKPPSAGGLPQ